MKTTILKLFVPLVILTGTLPVTAQQSNRELEKEFRSKPLKEAKRETKKFKKQGYYVAPGALPMEKQLGDAWLKQLEKDDQGSARYLVATGNSVAESQTAAKLQATETAKLDLAGQITTDIAALIENNIANEQLSNEDAASVTKTVAASKSLIAQELGRIITMVEMYRKIDKNIEADVRLAYDYASAREAAKKVIRKRLEEETDLLQEKLERLMKF